MNTPIETVQGNGGGVQIPDWYHPHRYIFSEEQYAVLEDFMGIADDYKKEILCQMLAEFRFSVLSSEICKEGVKMS